MKRILTSVVTSSCMIAGAAYGESYNGTNVGGSEWARPFADGTCCSGLGPVRFSTQVFHVDAAGGYDFNSIQNGFDGYLFVYADSFDPNLQTVNFVAGDDDGNGGIGTSDIHGLVLDANRTYVIVTTGFENGEEGSFVNTVDGLGNVLFQAFVPGGVNGALPDAGAIAGISLGLHDAFISFLNADGALAGSGASTNGSIEPLQYADGSQPKGNGTQAFAMALGEAGGNMTLSSTGEARTFLFGGYTTGDIGYTAGTLDFNGYIVGLGAERAVTANMVLGIAGGYAEGDGDISGVYNSITNRELIVSPYARLSDGGGTTLDGRISFASESWEYERVAGAGVASADFDGWSFGARVALSHAYSAGEYTFTPLASLSYLRTSVNGYTETGAGAVNLVVPSFVQEHGEAFAGITAARDWVSSSGKAMRGFVGAGVGTGFLGDETIQTNVVGSATAFATQVQGVNDAFARLSAGFTAEIQTGLKFSATYTGTFGEDREQHTLGGKLIASF